MFVIESVFQMVSDVGHPCLRGSACAEDLQVCVFHLFHHTVAVQTVRFEHAVHTNTAGTDILCALCESTECMGEITIICLFCIVHCNALDLILHFQ